MCEPLNIIEILSKIFKLLNTFLSMLLQPPFPHSSVTLNCAEVFCICSNGRPTCDEKINADSQSHFRERNLHPSCFRQHFDDFTTEATLVWHFSVYFIIKSYRLTVQRVDFIIESDVCLFSPVQNGICVVGANGVVVKSVTLSSPALVDDSIIVALVVVVVVFTACARSGGILQ